MNNIAISILKNQTFFEILSELKYFSEFKLKFCSDFESYKNELKLHEDLRKCVKTKCHHIQVIAIRRHPTMQSSSPRVSELGGWAATFK